MNPSSSSRERRHALLAEVEEIIGDLLTRKHGLSPETAADVGISVADMLRDRWGGQHIYFVQREKHHLSKRDWEIYRKMGRGKYNELAQEYGISYTMIYRIFNRCVSEVRKHREPDLFEALALDTDADVDRTDAPS